MPTFFSLHVAMSGLRAHQHALSVTAHNIANAGTQGYHRQSPRFIAGNPLTGAFAMSGIGVPQLGTGVTVESIERMQSQYIDNQIRTAGQWREMWNYRDQALKQLESVLSEPSSFGLSDVLNKFWNSWEDLSVSPEDLSTRISVIESGVALADRIGSLHRSLRDFQTRADQDIVDNAGQINRLAHEIAHLNDQITRSSAGGYQPNDLLDRRDVLLDQLAGIARVQISGTGGSDMYVSINGKTLIQANHVNEITVIQGDNGWSKLVWVEDGSDVHVSGGSLRGQMEIRDAVIEGYIQDLDRIARAIVDRVNEVHSTGITIEGLPAGNFFVPGGGASDMRVEATPLTLAVTSPDDDPIFNSLPQAISAIRNEALIDGETIGGSYSGLVGRIGSHSREAASRAEGHTLSLHQLRAQRESISGVSIDEEMLNMVKYQQAYNASARIATVIDEMIDTIISRMGVGGR